MNPPSKATTGEPKGYAEALAELEKYFRFLTVTRLMLMH